MTGDAGSGEIAPRTRRPGRAVLIAVAVLLLLGGGTAVAVGIADQDADPPTPAVAATSEPGAATTPGPEAEATGGVRPEAAPPAATPSGSPSPTPVAPPVSISIPAIGVASELITLGLNPDGTLAVPQPGPDYDKAAWFDGSPRPGAVGPAVIEGHVDSAANGPSVFYSLGELVAGDRVEVARADGTVVAFVVDEVRVVPKDDFPTLDVYGNTEGAELRLITCGGPFDSSVRSYVDNVVVFASAVA
ncbi:class F sortase [Blastococcus litoris]|uniref:class F sortase n=1 Tax=Blastococcus litoris TaxID=2171622 RepID=UPI000E301C2A|nr:class F sortase [Blastococcus litoris]